MTKPVSPEAEALLTEMEACISKALPLDSECKTPLSPLDRREWSDLKIELLHQITNVLFIEKGFTLAHELADIGEVAGISAEAIRQTEQKALKKVRKNNTEDELGDFKEATEEIFNSSSKVIEFQNNLFGDGKVG